MRLLAYRLAALLILLLARGTSAQGPQHSSFPVALIAIRMVTPQIGWGLTEHRLVRTDDAGRVWRAIPVPLPHGVYDMLDLSVAFAVHGIERVWLVPSFPVRQGSPQLVVLSTVAGGRDWHRSSPQSSVHRSPSTCISPMTPVRPGRQPGLSEPRMRWRCPMPSP